MHVRCEIMAAAWATGPVRDAACGRLDWIPVVRQDRSVSTADERARGAPRRRQAEANVGVSRAGRSARSPHGAFNPRKHVPATVEFADIATGGGARPELRRCSTSRVPQCRRAAPRRSDVPRPLSPPSGGSIDPARDVRTMEDEADPRRPRRRRAAPRTPRADLKKDQRRAPQRTGDPAALPRALEAGKPLRALSSVATTRSACAAFSFCPRSHCCSSESRRSGSDPRPTRPRSSPALRIVHGRRRDTAVLICAKIELEIASARRRGRRGVHGGSRPPGIGLDRVIRASYDLLGYISFFTVGEDECRAWSIPREHAGGARGRRSTATSLAASSARGRPLRALIARGTLAACSDHGELRLEGKEYIVLDGDVINFRHAT